MTLYQPFFLLTRNHKSNSNYVASSETHTPKVEDSSMPIKWHLNRTKLTILVKVHFDFLYALCLSPVRFVQNQKTGHFYKKSWLPQKILSVILNVLSVFAMACSLRRSFLPFASLPDRKPKSYLQLFLRVATTAYKANGVKTFWRHGHVHVLNCIMTEPNLPLPFTTREDSFWVQILSPYFVYTLYGSVIITVIFAVGIGYGVVVPSMLWTPQWWLRRFAGLARVTFYFETPLNSTTEAPELSELSRMDWTITVLTLLGTFQHYAFGFFMDAGILAAALTLNTTAKSLSTNIKNGIKFENQHTIPVPLGLIRAIDNHPVKGVTWSSIYSQYLAIQNLCDKINSALGSQVAFYLTEGLIYYSGNLNSVMVTVDPYEKFQLSMLFLVSVCILKTAADISCHMSSIRSWLRKSLHRHQAPLVEVSLVLHELANNEIGLKGSGMFTVTYGFLGGFLGLVITFFMISLQ